jgi:hypothetical protein
LQLCDLLVLVCERDFRLQQAHQLLLTLRLPGKNAFDNIAKRHAFLTFPSSLRSPMADHGSRGVICGLTLESGENALARLYLAAVQGIAYQTQQIIEKMNASGHKVSAGSKLMLSDAFQNAGCLKADRSVLPLLEWFFLVPHEYNANGSPCWLLVMKTGAVEHASSFSVEYSARKKLGIHISRYSQIGRI